MSTKKHMVINIMLFSSGLTILFLLFKDILLGFDKVIITGDYISSNSFIYFIKTFFIWNPFERLGIFNYDYVYYSWLVKFYGLLLYLIIKSPYAGNIFFITPIFISYSTMYLYLWRFVNKIFATSLSKVKIGLLAIPVISVYYALNPWIANRILSGHLYIVYSYAFIPLILLCLENVQNKISIKNMILLALSLSLAINSIQVTIILAIMLVLYFLFIIFTERKTNFRMVIFSKIVVGLVVLFIIVLPFLLSLFYSIQLHTYAKNENTCYSWLLNNLKTLNIITLRSYWWNDFSHSIYSLNNVMKALEVIIYAIAIMFSMIAVHKIKYFRKGIAFLFLIYVMLMGLSFLTAWFIEVECNNISEPRMLVQYWVTLYRDPDKLLILLPFIYSIYFMASLILLSLFDKKFLSILYLLLILIFTIVYTMVNPILIGSFPLTVVKLPSERLYLYSKYNDMLEGNVLFLPTDQYLVYKWIKYEKPLGDLNKYFLAATNAGPPMDPNYDYSNISLLLIELQKKIYSGSIFNRNDCNYILKILKLLNIKTIIVQKDVLLYNFKINKFIEFLNKSCNLFLEEEYPNKEFIAFVKISLYPEDKLLMIEAIINGHYYEKSFKIENPERLLNSIQDAKLKVVDNDPAIKLYSIGVSECFPQGNANCTVNWIKNFNNNFVFNGSEIINRTIVIVFKPLYISLANNVHHLLVANGTLYVHILSDEKFAVAISDNVKIYEAVFDLTDTEYIKIYKLKQNFQTFTLKGNATIVNIEYIDFTKYRLTIHAGSKFLLLYHIGYDPFWEAQIYKNGMSTERIKSTPVYGVINGFWINATGNLTVVIRYVPQGWFEFGLKVSGSTFVLAIFYLVWDWRRDRGDRWALIIERVFKKYLSKIMSYLRR